MDGKGDVYQVRPVGELEASIDEEIEKKARTRNEQCVRTSPA